MIATELRIGNLIEYQNDVFEIWNLRRNDLELDSEILDSHIHSIKYESVKPISLTDEWLLKFGFKKGSAGYELLIQNKRAKLSVVLRPDGIGMVGVAGPWGLFDSIHYKYVHQLQNLYFALTGEELSVE